MQHLEVSGVVRHIYIYVVRQLRVKVRPSSLLMLCGCISSSLAFSYNTSTFVNLIHSSHNHPPMKMEQTECSETSAHKIQKPGNNPEESTRHIEHGEILKTRIFLLVTEPDTPLHSPMFFTLLNSASCCLQVQFISCIMLSTNNARSTCNRHNHF